MKTVKQIKAEKESRQRSRVEDAKRLEKAMEDMVLPDLQFFINKFEQQHPKEFANLMMRDSGIDVLLHLMVTVWIQTNKGNANWIGFR